MIGITPYQVAKPPGELQDMCTDVYKLSARLEASVRPGLKQALSRLLLFVNSYYSNKMEGNPTKPIDVINAQREVGLISEEGIISSRMGAVAKSKKNSAESNALDAMTEIAAHIFAQQHLSDNPPSNESVVSESFILAIHHAFFSHLSESQRQLVHPTTGKIHLVEPGCFRQTMVEVGNHVAPGHEDLNGLMDWLAKAYRLDWLHGNNRLLAAAAAHHRLLRIHPFLDGNGRVCRLFTDVYLQQAGVEAGGLWSLSRGFYRSIDTYKAKLALADQPRQGSTDGRGVLSDRGLLAFQEYFLQTCIEQIDYIYGLLDMPLFDQRMQLYVALRASGGAVDANGEPLPKWRPQTEALLRAVINSPQIMRSHVPQITGLGETMSRKLVNQLIQEGWLVGEEKQPLVLRIPYDGISVLFPHLWWFLLVA